MDTSRSDGRWGEALGQAQLTEAAFGSRYRMLYTYLNLIDYSSVNLAKGVLVKCVHANALRNSSLHTNVSLNIHLYASF